jgi:hypothetical protein
VTRTVPFPDVREALRRHAPRDAKAVSDLVLDLDHGLRRALGAARALAATTPP